MFIENEQTKQSRNVSQPNLGYCSEYVKSCFREYGGISDVVFYEPSDNLIKQVEEAQKRFKEVCPSIIFPNSYFLFVISYFLFLYDVVPSSNNYSTIIIEKNIAI